MPKGQLEHANLTVTDPQRSAALLEKLCDWHERWRGPAMNGGETIHVGNETTYLALYTNPDATGGYRKGVPLNHVGLLVDDLETAEEIVIEAGLEPFGHADYAPGRRFYFFDWDGIEFEVLSYL
ncbi:VOC family protein [Altererythrobacter sp. C41]|uniref:VOC family protein n=1 Tax=Altererythrobacter sp. C41 TaxID=2806021 RepID=UPI001932B641|nr:VOC family protein [Altererythrobacter sp. C41]MBM0169090.1 VOC family protein [Altererythrobacter sp. C41]